MQKNPELEVIAMVDCEIIGEDDCNRYAGSFGSCEKKEYAVFGDRIYFDRDELKEDYYNANDDCYEEHSGEELEKKLDEDTEHLWKEAIIVNINAL